LACRKGCLCGAKLGDLKGRKKALRLLCSRLASVTLPSCKPPHSLRHVLHQVLSFLLLVINHLLFRLLLKLLIFQEAWLTLRLISLRACKNRRPFERRSTITNLWESSLVHAASETEVDLLTISN